MVIAAGQPEHAPHAGRRFIPVHDIDVLVPRTTPLLECLGGDRRNTRQHRRISWRRWSKTARRSSWASGASRRRCSFLEEQKGPRHAHRDVHGRIIAWWNPARSTATANRSTRQDRRQLLPRARNGSTITSTTTRCSSFVRPNTSTIRSSSAAPQDGGNQRGDRGRHDRPGVRRFDRHEVFLRASAGRSISTAVRRGRATARPSSRCRQPPETARSRGS